MPPLESDAVADDLRRLCGGLPSSPAGRATLEVKHGDPARAIVQSAVAADLLVMATHGRSGFKWLLRSSVTERAPTDHERARVDRPSAREPTQVGALSNDSLPARVFGTLDPMGSPTRCRWRRRPMPDSSCLTSLGALDVRPDDQVARPRSALSAQEVERLLARRDHLLGPDDRVEISRRDAVLQRLLP